MEKYGGRQVAFSAIVGSHNYMLNTPASDKDRKVFVLPTFEDLYKGNMHSESLVTETEDYDVHDVRKLGHLFYKANVNFLEVLYTTEFGFAGDARLYKHVMNIFDMKDEIVTMNLPYLFNACGGMYKNKMNSVNKGTEGTKHLVEQFGYDTKQLMSAYRIINFIVRFHATHFKDFKKAMTYDDKLQHGVMMSMKNGDWPKDEALEYVQTYHDNYFVPLKEVYHAQPVREDVREKLDSIIMAMVKEEVCK
jgi:uncharacterized protein